MPHTVSRIKEFEKPELPTCIKRIFLLLIGFTNSARAPTDPLAWLDETMFYESAEGFISADLSGTLDLEGYVFEGRPPGLLFNGDDFFNPGLSLFLDVELGPSVYLPPMTATRHIHWFTAVVLLFVSACAKSGKSARETCLRHQLWIWDAAGSHYLEQSMKPGEFIEPRLLTPYFPEGKLPRCLLGTNDYAAFRIFDGPTCPHDPTEHPPPSLLKKIEKIRANTK